MITKQRRKHYAQMTEQERQYIDSKIQYIRENMHSIKVSPHAYQRMTDNKLNILAIAKTLKNYSIIEYNTKPFYGRISHRALIRGNEPFKGMAVSMVLELNTLELITSYSCDFSDNHATLDWSNYDSRMNIFQELQVM